MARLLLALIPLIAIGVAYWAGTKVARSRPELSKDDKKELLWLQTLREDLIASASEHATLGDDFAVIALGMMRRPTKELP